MSAYQSILVLDLSFLSYNKSHPFIAQSRGINDVDIIATTAILPI